VYDCTGIFSTRRHLADAGQPPPLLPPLQSRKAGGAGKGKKRGAAVLVDDADSIQIKGRTYRCVRAWAAAARPRLMSGGWARPLP
jgi:hypothetical protein